MNEERSAVQFLGDAAALPVGREVRARVGELILLSRHHRAPAGDLLAELFSDLDLAILGEPDEVYDAYSDAIRAEYGHVPPHTFARGRGRILDAFLASPRIFNVLVDREQQARRNLRREREGLRGTALGLLREQVRRIRALVCFAAIVAAAVLVEPLVLLLLLLTPALSHQHYSWRRRVETSIRAGLLPYPDEPRRRRLWSALSDLYVDTEVDLASIAREVGEAGYSADEAWHALRYEVGPVGVRNFGFGVVFVPAPEWQPFDVDWLRTETLLRAASCPSPLRLRLDSVRSTWMVRHDFERVRALLASP